MEHSFWRNKSRRTLLPIPIQCGYWRQNAKVLTTLIMATLWNRASHYIFALWFLSFFFFLVFSSPNLSGRRLDVDHASTRCGPSVNLECRSEMCCMRLTGNAGPKKLPKICHLGTIAQLCRAISSQLRHVLTIGKRLVKQQYLPTCPYNMVNFSPPVVEIGSSVWGTPANFNGFRILAALLHSTLVVGISQTLRHWTEGETYIRQSIHHIGYWPTF